MALLVTYTNLFAAFILIALPNLTTSDEEFEGLSTLILEHSFDTGASPNFTKRGTITISSIKSGVAQFRQDNPLTHDEKKNLKNLVASGGLYRIRIPSKAANGGVNYVSSFLKACALYESKLSDLITVNVDLSGNILGISETASIPFCDNVEVDDEDLSGFKTVVEVVQTVAGPGPETQPYVQKLEQEKAEKAKGQQGDNRSFFAKYWMYIVPLFIFLMFASNQDPNQGGGGGGGGGGGR